jgi:hypothetical protein
MCRALHMHVGVSEPLLTGDLSKQAVRTSKELC